MEPAPPTRSNEGLDGEAVDGRRGEELALLSVASHDLRGALANARSYAAFLLWGCAASPERLARSAQVILRNVDRALQMAQEYFDTLRAELGGLPVEVAPVDPVPLLEQAIESCTALAEQREVRLRVELPAGVPRVSADVGRFVHAASAFVAQGLWRTPTHGELLVELAWEGAVVRVSVHDTGASLSPTELTAWFDPRFRARAEQKLEPGFRLCLAKREIEALGGHAGVVAGSAGATHWFELPALRG